MPNPTTRLPACSGDVGRRLLTLFLRAVALLRISTGLVAECFRMMGLIFRREISQCSLSSPADLWESTPSARACRLRILASGSQCEEACVKATQAFCSPLELGRAAGETKHRRTQQLHAPSSALSCCAVFSPPFPVKSFGGAAALTFGTLSLVALLTSFLAAAPPFLPCIAPRPPSHGRHGTHQNMRWYNACMQGTRRATHLCLRIEEALIRIRHGFRERREKAEIPFCEHEVASWGERTLEGVSTRCSHSFGRLSGGVSPAPQRAARSRVLFRSRRRRGGEGAPVHVVLQG